MKKEKNFLFAMCMLIAFLLWTLSVLLVDIQVIGPQESSVGFATINQFVHKLTGVHMFLYEMTDWLSIVPLIFIIGFALLGLIQLIKRKQLSKVDYSILTLGGFYIIVMAFYIFFELFVVNYRPVLINGYLESSYPSSTTMLVTCVMTTAIMQLNIRIKNKRFKTCVNSLIASFSVFMIISRLLSGVHWFTDIIGGILLSTGLVFMYRFVNNSKE